MHILPLALLVCSLIVTNSTASEIYEKPATLLVTGRIWTAAARRPWAEAVAVRDDRVVAVGSRDEVERLRGKRRASSMPAPAWLCRA